MENYDLSTITRDQLRFLLSTAKDEIVKFTRCHTELENCKTDIKIVKSKLEVERKQYVPKFLCFLLFLGCLYVSFLLFRMDSNELLGAKNNSFAFLILIIGILMLVVPYFITKSRIKDFTNTLEEYKNQLIDFEKKQMDALDGFFEIKKIPSTYRYPLALDTMLGFVENFRASTWKECADKYEEQLHRWQLEANGAESLRLQREIRNLTESTAKSAKAAAIFSGLNFFLK